MADLYTEVNESGKTLEVIFVSGDETPELYTTYYGAQPWVALPYKHELTKSLA